MSTANLRVLNPDRHRKSRSQKPTAGPRKPPIPLRPLHRMWRRTIDKIDIVPVELPVRRLASALKGVTACQISDLHVDREEDLARLQEAVRTINLQHPDLVFLTGDYFSGGDTMRRYIDEFRRALKDLHPKAGVFAILGNHDHWASATQISEALRGAGAEVLQNEHRRIAIKHEPINIVGIDDLWARRAEPVKAFRGLADDDCSIVLAHNPDTALYTRHLGPGVMLSGHTHGGVVRIPYYGSLIRSVLRIGPTFSAGLNRYNEFFIYTNRGLGTFWVRIRINCRPEISRFSLSPLAEAIPEPEMGEKPRGRRLRRPRIRATA